MTDLFPRALEIYLLLYLYLSRFLACLIFGSIGYHIYSVLLLCHHGKTPRKKQQRIRRTLGSKRQRFAERLRLWLRARLKQLLRLPPDTDQRGHDYGDTDFTDNDAIAFFRSVLRRDASEDPELYCCSPVSANTDSGDEF